MHVYNRGNRKQPIVRDAKDKWHFLQMLYYFNHEISVPNPFRELKTLLRINFNNQLIWPSAWRERKPIVKILSFSLVRNHFHLLLKEIQEGGVTMFMRKVGTGMANYFNTKYQESGRLFQGSYKARLVDTDNYLKYISVYIQFKNVLDLYPGGQEKAIREFNRLFDFAKNYPYCSLAEYASNRNSSIIDKDVLGEMFPDVKSYKNFCRDCFLGFKKAEFDFLTNEWSVED
ncbi:MAG: transposase IS200-family protein [Parcubacteria group bacterium LiPW_39]|nr:MAG: transposase IS200-family protein [Parcubacteria group bacterium LiPW_39]